MESECHECKDFDKVEELCKADLFACDFNPKCLLKMIIQELRIMNDDGEGEGWKA